MGTNHYICPEQSKKLKDRWSTHIQWQTILESKNNYQLWLKDIYTTLRSSLRGSDQLVP